MPALLVNFLRHMYRRAIGTSIVPAESLAHAYVHPADMKEEDDSSVTLFFYNSIQNPLEIVEA